MVKQFVILPFLVFILVGCDIFPKKDALSFTSTNIIRGERSNTTFNQIQNRILKPHCIECHSEYKNYQTVFSQRNSILRSVERNRMPKDAPALSLNLKQLLKEWVVSGAPLNGSPTGPTRPNVNQRGLSEKMKRLHAEHSKYIADLDKEKELNLITDGDFHKVEKANQGTFELQYAISKTIKMLVRLDIIENSCHPTKVQPCFLASHLKIQEHHLKWTKHEDPSKIGKTVMVADRDEYEEGEEVEYDEADTASIIGASIGAFDPKLDSGVRDYLICEDFSFLDGNEVKILSWSTENMETNSDTQANENRITHSAYNLKLKKYNENIYQIGVPEFVESFVLRSSFPMLNGEAGSFIYEEGDKQCMASFKLDIARVGAAFQEARSKIKLDFKTYIWGQDDSLIDGGSHFFNNSIEDSKTRLVK